MMTLKTIDGKTYINSEIRRPAIYLDHCALRKIAQNENLKEIFIAFLKTKGTLLFSVLNVHDIVGQDPGDSLDEIRLLLSEIGPHWVLININPVQIMHKVREAGLDNGKHYFDEDLLKTLMPRLHDGNLDLSKIMDLIDRDRESLRGSLDRQMDEHLKFIEIERTEYKSRRHELDVIYKRNSKEAFEAGRYVEASYFSLIRLVLVENFEFDENDGIDMFHSIVPLGLADMVVLDTMWKGLTDKVHNKFSKVVVFSCKEEVFKKFIRILYSQLSWMDKIRLRSAYQAVKK
jgi:hypothetical protein